MVVVFVSTELFAAMRVLSLMRSFRKRLRNVLGLFVVFRAGLKKVPARIRSGAQLVSQPAITSIFSCPDSWISSEVGDPDVTAQSKLERATDAGAMGQMTLMVADFL